MATITAQPVPNIAIYNQLHVGKGEDWQRVKPGTQGPVPIDFLVTLPGRERKSLSLRADADGTLAIVGDGKPIGTIRASGTPVRLTPQPFGPGYARLGIVEVLATAGVLVGHRTNRGRPRRRDALRGPSRGAVVHPEAHGLMATAGSTSATKQKSNGGALL